MSSSGFQQKTAEQRSLEGRKIVSYDDISINQRSNLPFLYLLDLTNCSVPFARPELLHRRAAQLRVRHWAERRQRPRGGLRRPPGSRLVLRRGGERGGAP